MATLSSKTGIPSFSSSGSGTGAINYFADPGFELGINGQIPAGWAQYFESEAVTFTDAGDLVTVGSLVPGLGDVVIYSVITGTTGIAINTAYFVINPVGLTFQLSLTSGGSAIALTTNGTGTMLRSKPKVGSGGAAVTQVTMLCSTTTPTRGLMSAVITKDAAVRTGVGFAYPFTISAVDKGVTSSVDVEIVTSAGYQTGNLLFYIYDVTNSILVTPNVQALPKLDNYGHFLSQYGLTNGTSYRFIFHVADTSATAWTVKMDTMINSTSRVAVPGGGPGPWLSYPAILTGAGSKVFTIGTFYRTNGSNIDIRFKLQGNTTASGAGATNITFSMPTNYTVHADGLYPYVAGFAETYGLVAASQFDRLVPVSAASSTTLQFIKPLTNNTYTQTDLNVAQQIEFYGQISVPVNELVGSGTNLLNQLTQSPIRAGTVMEFAGALIPTGWLDCDGTTKLIADYPQLAAQLGTTWATCVNTQTGAAYSAPAAGSFRLPDLRNAFLRGSSAVANPAGVTTALAGFQADTTNKNGLVLSGIAPSLGSNTVASSGHSHGLSTSSGSRLIVQNVGGTGSNKFIQTETVPASDRREITDGPSSTTLVTISDGSYSLGAGDAETRPDSVGIRRIIKAFDESFNLAGFANASSTSNGLVAPRKGQYDLTPVSRVTATGVTAWVTQRGVAIYYQDQDGNHRLKFNISGLFTAGSIGSASITIVGIVLKNIANYYQAVSGCFLSAAGSPQVQHVGNPGGPTFGCFQVAVANTNGLSISGDVELESKPTWA